MSNFFVAGSTPQEEREERNPQSIEVHAHLATDLAKSRLKDTAIDITEMGGTSIASVSTARVPPWTPNGFSRLETFGIQGVPLLQEPSSLGSVPFDATVSRAGRSSPPPLLPATARTGCFQPNREVDVRGKLTLDAQRLMEVADIEYLQTVDLIGVDERSSADGVVNVHADCDLQSEKVAELEPGTRFYIVENRELDDGTQRSLIVLEGDEIPLGWATAYTSDGTPLMLVFARPRYEVAKKPLKLRQRFEQTSKFLKQLSVGTKLHITEMRRTVDGTQRVCVIVIGDHEECGWVSSQLPDGRRTLRELKDDTPQGFAQFPPFPVRPKVDWQKRYAEMTYEALDAAAQTLLGMRPKIYLNSSQTMKDRAVAFDERAEAVERRVQPLKKSMLKGGRMPVNIVLAYCIRDGVAPNWIPLTPELFMKEGSEAGKTPSSKGKIAKMDFRMYVRQLLDVKDMTSSMKGADEIDSLFPELDKDDSGEIDIEEIIVWMAQLKIQLEKYEIMLAEELQMAVNYRNHRTDIGPMTTVTKNAEVALEEHTKAKAVVSEVGNQLGSVLKKDSDQGGKSMVEVAADWMRIAAGPVDKKSFRHTFKKLGLAGETDDIDRLHTSLCKRGGEKDGDFDDAGALAKALEFAIADSEKARGIMRACNIQIIETTRPLRPVQADYLKQMKVWEEEARYEEDREKRRRAEEKVREREAARKAKLVKRRTVTADALEIGESWEAQK